MKHPRLKHTRPPSTRNTPSIALLAPYSAMRMALDTLRLPNTTALTVDGAQGREHDYVIVATVGATQTMRLGSWKTSAVLMLLGRERDRGRLSSVIARPSRGRTMVERCGARLLGI